MRAHLQGVEEEEEALLISHCMQGAAPTQAAMAPLDASHADRPKRSNLPPKASLKSRGSILSHVTSGTWEEDADIENPHLAEEARKTPKVQAYALICTGCRHASRPRTILSIQHACLQAAMEPTPGVGLTRCRLRSPVHAYCEAAMESLALPYKILMPCAATLVLSAGTVFSDHWRRLWCAASTHSFA